MTTEMVLGIEPAMIGAAKTVNSRAVACVFPRLVKWQGQHFILSPPLSKVLAASHNSEADARRMG